jgi:hypothetical protein
MLSERAMCALYVPLHEVQPLDQLSHAHCAPMGFARAHT